MDTQTECESLFIVHAVFTQSEFVAPTNRRHFSIPVLHTDVQSLAVVVGMVGIECEREKIATRINDIVGEPEPEIGGKREFNRL